FSWLGGEEQIATTGELVDPLTSFQGHRASGFEHLHPGQVRPKPREQLLLRRRPRWTLCGEVGESAASRGRQRLRAWNDDLPALARRLGRVGADGLPVRDASIRVVEDEEEG